MVSVEHSRNRRRTTLSGRVGSTSAPILFVLLCAGVAWLATGVGLADIGLFLVYELGFVVAPGWIVYGILRARSGARGVRS